MGISEQADVKQVSAEGAYLATGILNTEGFLFYHIGCLFILADPKQPTLRLHADSVGDDFDFSICDVDGSFLLPPSALEGTCEFSLLAADFEEGGIKLTIYKDGIVAGEFFGVCEGLGEVDIVKRKGKLSIPKPKEHANVFKFVGESGIDSIKFHYGDVNSITPGEPWGDVTSESHNGGKTVEIKVDAGRKADKANAKWFNDTVNGQSSKMFHTRGGDNVPSELNFAIQGILEINKQRFNVCLGQGTSGTYNNWHLASEDIHSPHPHKGGDMGNYHFTQNGSNEFIVKKK